MTVRLGLFDSGVGGLTVLRRILERHGDVPCVYLGDTARVPYGNRTPEEIRSIASEVVGWLGLSGVSTVVMACNTTNALARDVAEASAGGVPVIGLIDAQHRWCVSWWGLATPATTNRRPIGWRRSATPGRWWNRLACLFVPLIESGDLLSDDRRIAVGYLEPLLGVGRVDRAWLRTTHYWSRCCASSSDNVLDRSCNRAHSLDAVLGAPSKRPGQRLSLERVRLCVTADASSFASRATPWLGQRPEVELVHLQQ